MDGWWKKNPFFVEYMVHEGTALFVAAYAAVLLVGVVRLSQGEAAWNGWLEALKSPLSLVFHLAVLVAMLYHSWTWFKIMPRTLPPILVGGKRVSAAAITASGLAAAAVASLVILVLAWGMGR
jgi:fumarate reductase subunit C